MNRTFIATILVLYLSSPAAPQKKSGREKDGLAGAVHILRTEVAPLVKQGGRYVEKLRTPSEPARTYDVNGRLLEEIIYTGDGSVSEKKVFSYDTSGNETGVAEYDANGHYLRKSVRVYDNDGNVIEDSLYNADGTLNIGITYTYDSEGQKTYSRGKVRFKKTITHDSSGNKVEVSEPVETSYGSREISTFDAKGNLIDRAAYSVSDGSFIFRTGTPRDAVGNLLAVIDFNADGSENSKDTISYDKKNNPLEVSHYNANGSLESKESYSREIDSHGNWVKETMSVCSTAAKPIVCEPRVVTYRKLIYY